MVKLPVNVHAAKITYKFLAFPLQKHVGVLKTDIKCLMLSL